MSEERFLSISTVKGQVTEAQSAKLLFASCWLYFDPVDGSSKFLGNVPKNLQTMSHILEDKFYYNFGLHKIAKLFALGNEANCTRHNFYSYMSWFSKLLQPGFSFCSFIGNFHLF